MTFQVEKFTSGELLPKGYTEWRKGIIELIEKAKYQTSLRVNADLLSLYWHIGCDILEKQKREGWGAQVVNQLSRDLMQRFPDDRGYSVRNLKEMRRFADSYPDFPIVQVSLAQLQKYPILKTTLAELQRIPIGQVGLAQIKADEEMVQLPLTQITWYHHISLLSKVKDPAEHVFYIMATASEGWTRDTMLTQIANGYIHAKGKSINNFAVTLPPIQSDLARQAFKDPYKFSFLGTVALQNELDIEKRLTERITDFLIEMGRGFAFVGRQYHITVDGDDYYIDLLMYHLKLHCYVVVELKAVEFIPEFVSKLNFYISAVDEYVKTPDDKPTIGLLLCRTKSDTKARFALRGITQPLGIAQYETEKLFADVASALPQIDEIEKELEEDEV